MNVFLLEKYPWHFFCMGKTFKVFMPVSQANMYGGILQAYRWKLPVYKLALA